MSAYPPPWPPTALEKKHRKAGTKAPTRRCVDAFRQPHSYPEVASDWRDRVIVCCCFCSLWFYHSKTTIAPPTSSLCLYFKAGAAIQTRVHLRGLEPTASRPLDKLCRGVPSRNRLCYVACVNVSTLWPHVETLCCSPRWLLLSELRARVHLDRCMGCACGGKIFSEEILG